MSVCIRCGAVLGPTDKFCGSCGYIVKRKKNVTFANYSSSTNNASRQSVCLRCGEKLNDGNKFCGKCGYSVQRKTSSTIPNSNNSNSFTPQQTKTKAVHIPVCIRCGEKLDGLGKPCGKCGYDTNSSKNQTEAVKQSTDNSSHPMTREEYVKELNHLCDYFGYVQSKYNEYDDCVRISRRKRREYLEDKEDSMFDPKILLVVIGLGVFVMSFIFILTGVYSFRIYEPWVGIALIFLGLSSGPCGYFLMKVDLETQDYRNNIKQYNSRQADLATELTCHYVNYGSCIVSPEYTDPRILAMIRDNMRNGRAETLNNAIKLIYRDHYKTEYKAKKLLRQGKNINSRFGKKTAYAFIPASYFLTRTRYY